MKKLKITFNSPIILGFVFICFAATLLGVITGGFLTSLLFSTYRASFANPLTYIRLFTHVFGHAGFAHFIGNASYILLVGPMLEEKYGSRVLIEVIAITAFLTGIINMIFSPHTSLCGASGVVFALIIIASYTGFQNGEIPLTFILVVIIYIGQQILEGITSHDNVSQLTHIVGGLIGAFIGYILNCKKDSKR